MENKTTIELLDLLSKLVDKKTGELKDGYDEAFEELKLREPFYSLFHPRSDSTLEEELEDIRDEIKKLKRHKHDPQNGDVLIRI
jgi:hypothetical protein